MKKQTLAGAFCAGFFTLGMLTTADAALLGRLPATPGGTDYQAYYDTTLDITWLADANLAASNTFGTAGIIYNGRMRWDIANTWIGNMNSAGYLGYSDWRLPSVTDVGNDGATYTNIYQGVDFGYNIDTANGELASLWYDTLGNTAYYDTAGNPTGCAGYPNYCLTNTGPFSNIQSDFDYRSEGYWSGVEYAPDTAYAWYFNTRNGLQRYYPKRAATLYGWAVRSGDVSAVPVPAAVWLFSSGLIGLLGMAKRKR